MKIQVVIGPVVVANYLRDKFKTGGDVVVMNKIQLVPIRRV
jgi:hypothetical protein